MKPQRAIPCVHMRGGTSRALFFHARDPLFRAARGSPYAYERQLDGMSRGITSLSKIAVFGPPTHPGADVDYTFVQVDSRRGSGGYRGNCGNISSAVGLFALEERLVDSGGDEASIVIHNTNMKKLIRTHFVTVDRYAAVKGDLRQDGVAGSGAPVKLAFPDAGGATTDKLLPSGHARDRLTIESPGGVEVSMMDACNPVVMIEASALGLSGIETPAELNANPRAMELFEHLRVQAAVEMGLVDDPADARTKMTNLPLVALLSKHAAVQDGMQADIVVRMIWSGQPHKATQITGAMCLTIAAQIDDTVIQDVRLRTATGRVALRHRACVGAAACGRAA